MRWLVVVALLGCGHRDPMERTPHERWCFRLWSDAQGAENLLCRIPAECSITFAPDQPQQPLGVRWCRDISNRAWQARGEAASLVDILDEAEADEDHRAQAERFLKMTEVNLELAKQCDPAQPLATVDRMQAAIARYAQALSVDCEPESGTPLLTR